MPEAPKRRGRPPKAATDRQTIEIIPEVAPKRRGRPPKPKTDPEIAENINLDVVTKSPRNSRIKNLESVSPKSEVTKKQKADKETGTELIKGEKPKSASKEKIQKVKMVEQ